MTKTSEAAHTHGAVVVGVDGSPASWSAIHTGAWEAARRHHTLVLTHGYGPLLPYHPFVQNPDPGAASAPATMLADITRETRTRYPHLTIHSEIVAASGASALLDRSRTASLIVVGSRGHGGFAGLSIGSVATQIAAHATCPVIVVRHHNSAERSRMDEGQAFTLPGGPILVAVGGSPYDEATMRYAFEEASLRNVAIIAAHVWSLLPEVAIRSSDLADYNNYAAPAEAERVIAEAIAGWAEKYPNVPVERRPIESMNTSYALIEASSGCGLIALGCRGRGGFAGLLLGSVSRDLVGHAHNDVAVVHDHR